MRWQVGAFAIAAACLTPRSDRPAAPADDVEPSLVLVAPDRGTFVEGTALTVTGRVHDDGAVRVTVNGVDIATAPDGTFSTTVAVSPGLAIFETHAIDATGHDVRDVRSVLVGPFATSDGTSRGALGARLGRGGLVVLGKALARSAKAIDFTAAGRALNPVYDEGDCLGATVDIATLAVGTIDVALAPKPSAIETTVTLDDVVVNLDVRYKVACIGGYTTMTVRTRANVRGDLKVVLSGRFYTSLPNPTVELEDFRVDIGGVPGPIERLVRGRIRAGIEQALTKAIAKKVPPLANARLADLLAKPQTASLFGRELTIDVVPRKLEMTTSSIFVAADAGLVVAGGETGRYVSTRATIAPDEGDPIDAAVWISADAIDQLLAGLWAAHAFEHTVSVDALGPLAMLFDAQVRTIHVALSLPPTVRADELLELAIGDLNITLRDAAGAELQRFAVSLRSTLKVKPGKLALSTTEPKVYAQLLGQSTTRSASADGRPLDATAVEGLVKVAWTLVATMVDDALARVPLPDIGFALEVSGARGGVIVLSVTVGSH